MDRSRSVREQELLEEVHKLTDQKYHLELLNSRAQVANNMLQKQYEESQQTVDEIRQGISQAVTSSIEYIELRDRYRNSLLEMRALRT